MTRGARRAVAKKKRYSDLIPLRPLHFTWVLEEVLFTIPQPLEIDMAFSDETKDRFNAAIG